MTGASVPRIVDPIFYREMRQASRLGRTPWIILCLVVLMALLVAFVGGLAGTTEVSPASVGAILFQVYFSTAMLIVTILAPAVAANAIAAEREGRTWEALLLTGLTPRAIARGKFLAAYAQVAVYLVALAPVGAVPFVFGGVTATETVVAFAFLFLFAALAVAYGLAVSSLVPSLRAAIVVTLVLAIVLGPSLFSFFGFGLSVALHEVWPEVPQGSPIWLPIAWVRAPFGLAYLVYLVAMPLVGVAIPAWYFYVLTLTSLTGEADDRTSPLKIWFAIATPLLAVTAAAPALLLPSAPSRTAATLVAFVVVCLHLTFAALHFAEDTPGPSRRVRRRWSQDGASALRRYFGPGIGRTFTFVLMHGTLAIGIVLGLGILGAQLAGATPPDGAVVVAFYGVMFLAFVAGLVGSLRARGLSPWATRLIAVGILAFVSLGPWVVAAVGGAVARDDDWLALAAPSPFYAFYMAERMEHPSGVGAELAVGMAAAVLWGLLGAALLIVAARKGARFMAEHEAALAQADAAFAAEEAAERAARTPSQAPATAREPAPAVATGPEPPSS